MINQEIIYYALSSVAAFSGFNILFKDFVLASISSIVLGSIIVFYLYPEPVAPYLL